MLYIPTDSWRLHISGKHIYIYINPPTALKTNMESKESPHLKETPLSKPALIRFSCLFFSKNCYKSRRTPWIFHFSGSSSSPPPPLSPRKSTPKTQKHFSTACVVKLRSPDSSSESVSCVCPIITKPFTRSGRLELESCIIDRGGVWSRI